MENKDLELLISQYVDGELSDRMSDNVSRLIENDPSAAALYADFQDLRAGIRSLPRFKLPADFPQTVLNNIQKRSAQTGIRHFSVRFIRKRTLYILSITAASILILIVPIFFFTGSGHPSMIASNTAVDNQSENVQLPPGSPLAVGNTQEKQFDAKMEIHCVTSPEQKDEFLQRLQLWGTGLKLNFSKKFDKNQIVIEYHLTKEEYSQLVSWLSNSGHLVLSFNVSNALTEWQQDLKIPAKEKMNVKITID